MSRLKARILEIESVENLNIVKFSFNSTILTMMSLDLSENMVVGRDVYLVLKPTHIVIAKEFSGLVSFSNKMEAIVESVENGKLLSCVKLLVDGVVIESIITLESAKEMNLKIGDRVTAMLKASELSIAEVIDV